MTTTRKPLEPLATDADLVAELLLELDEVAEGWRTFGDRHPGTSDIAVAMLRTCAGQLASVITRHRRYAEVDADA